jgi:hypothetical protein
MCGQIVRNSLDWVSAGDVNRRDRDSVWDYTRPAMLRRTFLLIGLVFAGLASAQEPDPPERVARLSFLRGEVTFQAADNEAPEQAALNRPVTTGDRVMTGNDARAELTLGGAALRLDARTDLTVANLDADIAHVEVNSGTIGVTLRTLEAGDTFEVDAPNGTVRLLEPGEYRVEAAADGAAIVEVRSGVAEIDSGAGPTRVASGQRARLGSTERIATLLSLGAEDEFDRWGRDRERQLKGDEPARYVSRDMVGYEDLDDRYGRWNSEPGYGHVWFPTVVAGWSPYTYGRWTWISPWGWTWIDAAPWGFAPFHYGRWAFVRSRWCWVPGPRHRHPIYAPAHVAWVGGHRGFSRGERPVGWFPLGPRDVYVPGHRVSPRYLRNVNVSNAHIDNNAYITNVYRRRVGDVRYANRDVPGAFRSMPRDSFASERPVPRHRWHPSPGRNPSVGEVSGNPGVEPLRRFRIHSPPQSAVAARGNVRAAPSQALEARQPVKPRYHWRSEPRQWGQSARTPESSNRIEGSRSFTSPRSDGARTYGRPGNDGSRSYGTPRNFGEGRGMGARGYGSPMRQGSAERSAPRYSSPPANSSRPMPSASPPPSSSSGRAAAPRADSSGARTHRGGRLMRQQ